MSYTATIVKDLSVSTPTEGSTLPSELNDAIREIKTVLKGLYGYVEKSANATLLITETFVVCKDQSEAITLTLPAAASSASSAFGKPFFIRNYGTFIVTVDGNSSETIDGSTTLVLRPGTACILICNGTAWYSHRPQPRFRGARAYNTTDQTIDATDTTLTFDAETYDTDSIHSTSSETGRLTVPVGVTYVRVTAQVQIKNDESTDDIWIVIYQDGSLIVAKWQTEIGEADTLSAGTTVQLTTGVIPVTAGAYFTVVVKGCSNATESDNTWFSMEIVE